jgi:hypothetical protein
MSIINVIAYCFMGWVVLGWIYRLARYLNYKYVIKIQERPNIK